MSFKILASRSITKIYSNRPRSWWEVLFELIFSFKLAENRASTWTIGFHNSHSQPSLVSMYPENYFETILPTFSTLLRKILIVHNKTKFTKGYNTLTDTYELNCKYVTAELNINSNDGKELCITTVSLSCFCALKNN